ncbi:MAG: phosphosulfolactate synthase [bacterium]
MAMIHPTPPPHFPLVLPKREQKPRKTGITAITDLGLPLAQQHDLLESYSDLLDIAKLGTGAAYINPKLVEKVELYQSFHIPVYLGGTLFEKFYQQNKLDDYQKFLQDLDITWVEISSGVMPIPINECLAIINDFQQEFTVVAEVGRKFDDMSSKQWLKDIEAYLMKDVHYVILEGRGQANAGIYNQDGFLNTTLIEDINHHIDHERLLFEAGTEKAQIQLINQFGTNINLGNIHFPDIVSLETLRMGLRADTFDIK